jgi:hypothetical protein
VADQACGHAAQPVAQGGDHGLAVADAVTGQRAGQPFRGVAAGSSLPAIRSAASTVAVCAQVATCGHLSVPKTSVPSCNLLIFVDQTLE